MQSSAQFIDSLMHFLSESSPDKLSKSCTEPFNRADKGIPLTGLSMMSIVNCFHPHWKLNCHLVFSVETRPRWRCRIISKFLRGRLWLFWACLWMNSALVWSINDFARRMCAVSVMVLHCSTKSSRFWSSKKPCTQVASCFSELNAPTLFTYTKYLAISKWLLFWKNTWIACNGKIGATKDDTFAWIDECVIMMDLNPRLSPHTPLVGSGAVAIVWIKPKNDGNDSWTSWAK